MDCQLSSTSMLPGIWVIEALAHSNQVDISLLLALLQRTPQLSDDLGKNAREVVSLRILQSFIFQGTRPNSVSSASGQKITLDPSDRCEDVLRRILSETPPSHLKPFEPEIWKWDLEPFIENKRSSLGKYALQQLKDAILTGSHPSLSSLKEKCGLLVENRAEHGASEDNVNCNGIASRHGGVKRKRRAINENAGGNSCENQTHIESVKKYRQDIIGGKLVSSGIDTELESTSKASNQHGEGEKCSLEKESPENDNSKRTSLKELVGNFVPGKNQVCSDEEKVQDHPIEEAKGDQEITNEESDKIEQNIQRNVSNGSEECTLKGLSIPDLGPEKQSPQYGTEAPNEKLDGEQRRDQDHDGVSNAKGYKNGLRGMEAITEDSLEQNIPKTVSNVDEAEKVVDISSDSEGCNDERTSIDTKKKMFLSSQCTYSEDSLATTDFRDLNLCVKCNKGGKLLVCSSDSCPVVIHESCLCSDTKFVARGKFYCPFCAYSQAISRYTEIKRKTSLARKDLATFICLANRDKSKKRDDRLPKSNELNNRDVVKKVSNHKQKKLEYEQAGGPLEVTSHYTPPFKAPHILDNDKQEGKRKKRQVSESPRVHGQDQMAALAIHKSQDDNNSCKIIERNNEGENRRDMRSKKGVLCQPEKDVNECSPSTQSDAEEISEEESDNSGASKYFKRGRKLEKELSYPAIPQLRRKRIPWTTAEEETLKEGMRLLCSPHDKIIPWKKVMEFGSGIFQQSRTTMDLKDKWRNMTKATTRS